MAQAARAARSQIPKRGLGIETRVETFFGVGLGGVETAYAVAGSCARSAAADRHPVGLQCVGTVGGRTYAVGERGQ